MEAKSTTQELIRIRTELEGLETALKSQSESQEFTELEEQLTTLCMTEALTLLDMGDAATSLTLLKRAERLTEKKNQKAYIEVLELFSCYFGKVGKPQRALTYLDRARDIEETLPCYETRGKTHLNYCALFSQMGKYDKAMSHVLKAIMKLQDSLLCAALRGDDKRESQVEDLAVAYYNLAVQYEFKKEFVEAQKWFQKAISFANAHLPAENRYLQSLYQVSDSFLSKMQEMTIRMEVRKKRREKPVVDNAAYLDEIKKRIQVEKQKEWKQMRRNNNTQSAIFPTQVPPQRRGASLSPERSSYEQGKASPRMQQSERGKSIEREEDIADP